MPVLQTSLIQTWCKQAKVRCPEIGLSSSRDIVDCEILLRYCRYSRDIVANCLYWIVFDLNVVQQAQCVTLRSTSVQVEILRVNWESWDIVSTGFESFLTQNWFRLGAAGSVRCPEIVLSWPEAQVEIMCQHLPPPNIGLKGKSKCNLAFLQRPLTYWQMRRGSARALKCTLVVSPLFRSSSISTSAMHFWKVHFGKYTFEQCTLVVSPSWLLYCSHSGNCLAQWT